MISRSSSSPNSPPIRDGSPTTITSCVASVNPAALGDFFLLEVLFIPVLGVDEFAFVDLRFRLGLGARGVSAARKPSHMNCSLVEKLWCIHYRILQSLQTDQKVNLNYLDWIELNLSHGIHWVLAGSKLHFAVLWDLIADILTNKNISQKIENPQNIYAKPSKITFCKGFSLRHTKLNEKISLIFLIESSYTTWKTEERDFRKLIFVCSTFLLAEKIQNYHIFRAIPWAKSWDHNNLLLTGLYKYVIVSESSGKTFCVNINTLR